MDVWEDLPFEFEYKDSIGVQEYLKLLGLKIAMGDRDSKLYLSQKELEEVYKYIMYKKVMVLLLETGDEKECVKNEKILFVDSDYDEIMMYNN